MLPRRRRSTLVVVIRLAATDSLVEGHGFEPAVPQQMDQEVLRRHDSPVEGAGLRTLGPALDTHRFRDRLLSSRMAFKLPFDPPSVVIEGDKMTATAESRFIDYWERVR
jgi:hypothetical protein